MDHASASIAAWQHTRSVRCVYGLRREIYRYAATYFRRVRASLLHVFRGRRGTCAIPSVIAVLSNVYSRAPANRCVCARSVMCVSANGRIRCRSAGEGDIESTVPFCFPRILMPGYAFESPSLVCDEGGCDFPKTTILHLTLNRYWVIKDKKTWISLTDAIDFSQRYGREHLADCLRKYCGTHAGEIRCRYTRWGERSEGG